MAFFSKQPPKKKPEPAQPEVGPRPASARELAATTPAKARRHVEPAGDDMTVTGASLAQWTPARASFDVAQANPGLCAVLENAALRFANGHAADARKQLEEGIENDHDTKVSVLAWLALFDLLQRANDRAAFDRLAMQYVLQFERSAPAWEEAEPDTPANAPRMIGGAIAVTGKVTASSVTQIEGLRRAVSRQMHGARLDLMSMIDFDDTGARLLANALAESRRAGLGLQLLKSSKLDNTLNAALKRGRAAGEGAWLLSLEFLQWANDRSAFEDRAIEFAMAFELSPPSWEPPVAPIAPPTKAEEHDESTLAEADEQDMVQWSGVMTGSLAPGLGKLQDSVHGKDVVAVDMTEVERIDFVCAGALLNLIGRIESQHKSVQIVGASPILRALLLLIGVSPRHFVKKAQ
jgi:ABC-type transporter Mla MlaB component